MWPTDAEELVAAQAELASSRPEPWRPPGEQVLVGGCWATFPRGLTGPGAAGDRAWAAGVTMYGARVVASHAVAGVAGAPYTPGLLALRIGALLEQVARGLDPAPDVLLVDASGRDHPRRAGLAIQLGAELGLPTVGVTHRPLEGVGAWPEDRPGASSPVRAGEEVVGCWLRTRAGTRPVVVHPGWRVDLPTAVEVVAAAARGRRTPEPLRQARQLARRARYAADGPPASGRVRPPRPRG
jgi:deoxyribonuclease V